MQDDIFSLFTPETVKVKDTSRGAMSKTATFNVELQAVVKRRDSMSADLQNGDDRLTTTTVHFKASDAEYVRIGYYVEIDGVWHVIEQVRNGKDFETGEIKFVYAVLGSEIIDSPDDPSWGVSA